MKNISDPVRVFRIVVEGSGTTARNPRAPRSYRWTRWQVFGAGSVALVLALGWLAASRWWLPKPSQAPQSPLLSIAVLPFEATGTPDAAALSTPLRRGLAAALSQTVLGRAVVSPDAIDSSPAKGADVQALGKALDVRFVVQGNVERDTSATTLIRYQLLDAQTRVQARTGQIELSKHDSVDIGIGRLSTAVQADLYDAAASRLPAEPANDASALELVFRAWHKPLRGTERETLVGRLAL